MVQNGIIFQYFEWYMEDINNNLWLRLKNDAQHLQELGITSVWIPPAFKATSPFDTGYGVYDLYDLGEFDQKGSIKTKYGSKDELIAAIDALHKQNIQVYADVVLNHKASGDEKEVFMAKEMDSNDRTQSITDYYEIEAWTKFTFPGRNNKYSSFKWNWTHFSGVDFNARENKRAIYLIKGINKGWAQGVSYEKGNFDYLMYNNIDYQNQEVVEEIERWALWFVEETKVDGFRLDAVKHINDYFARDLIYKLKNEYRHDFYVVGEYWNQNIDEVSNYLENTDFMINLFDVSLHFNMYEASKSGDLYDMRQIFDKTLVQEHPDHVVTFVNNHDSQPKQALESWVRPWFQPLAYALILLRKAGYPKVFYGDYYGITTQDAIEGEQIAIDRLLYLRKWHAYGEETDYFDDHNVIGWVRHGNEEYPYGCVVIMSNGHEGAKVMNVGKLYQGAIYADYTGNRMDKIMIDNEGNARFWCNGGSVSVWVKDNINKDEAYKPRLDN